MAHSSQSIAILGGLILTAALPLAADAAPAAVPATPAAPASAPAAPGGTPAADAQAATPAAPSPEAAASAAKGTAILDRLEAKLAAAKTITLAGTLTMMKAKDTPPITIKSTAERPGLFRADVLQNDKEIGKVVSNTNGGYVYDTVKNRYMKVDKGNSPEATLWNAVNTTHSLLPSSATFGMIVTTALLKGAHPFKLTPPAGSKITVTVSANAGTVNGKPVEDVTQTLTNGATGTAVHLSVDEKTELPVRLAYNSVSNGQETGILQVDFSAYGVSDKSASASTFQYTPPATATAYTPPPPEEPKPLLANGAAAPNFAVEDVSGKTVHLADFAGKVVVIDYWATWCGPCQSALPGTDKVAKEYQPKGVVFLPVCSWDDKSAFTPWVNDRKNWSMTFYFDPAGRGKDSIAGTLYKVSGIPTQFVIGKDGKVAWSTVGYDGENGEKNLSAAIEKALAGS